MTLEEAWNVIEEISKLERDEGIDFRYVDTLYIEKYAWCS